AIFFARDAVELRVAGRQRKARGRRSEPGAGVLVEQPVILVGLGVIAGGRGEEVRQTVAVHVHHDVLGHVPVVAIFFARDAVEFRVAGRQREAGGRRGEPGAGVLVEQPVILVGLGVIAGGRGEEVRQTVAVHVHLALLGPLPVFAIFFARDAVEFRV